MEGNEISALALSPRGIWNWLKDTFPDAFAWVGENWQTMLAVLIPPVGIFLWLKDTFPDAFAWVGDKWQAMKDALDAIRCRRLVELAKAAGDDYRPV